MEYDHKTWSGRLDRLAITDTEFGDWRLKQAASITANAENAKLGVVCLQSQPSEICVDGRWDKIKGADAKVTIDNLRADRFQDWLPEDILVDTALQGTAKGSLSAKGTTRGSATFTFSPGVITLSADSEPFTIDLNSGNIEGRLKDDKLDSDIKLDLGDLGSLLANLGLQNLSASPRLAGKVAADIRDLTIISSFAPPTPGGEW